MAMVRVTLSWNLETTWDGKGNVAFFQTETGKNRVGAAGAEQLSLSICHSHIIIIKKVPLPQVTFLSDLMYGNRTSACSE